MPTAGRRANAADQDPRGFLDGDQLVRLADAADNLVVGSFISPPEKMRRFIM